MTNKTVPRVCELLERTPNILREWLDGLPERWTLSNYGPDTFSPWDVLSHLVHGEHVDWMPRIRHVLANGEEPPFEPYIMGERLEFTQGKSTEQLLEEFDALRDANLEELRALELTEADLQKAGTHPALGKATIGDLLCAWAAHDQHHIAQIGKCMARQFAGEVGPFEAYLGILSESMRVE